VWGCGVGWGIPSLFGEETRGFQKESRLGSDIVEDERGLKMSTCDSFLRGIGRRRREGREGQEGLPPRLNHSVASPSSSDTQQE